MIAETKGLQDLDVPLKMERLKQWCADINQVQADVKYDFVFVDGQDFRQYAPDSFGQLLANFTEFKEITC